MMVQRTVLVVALLVLTNSNNVNGFITTTPISNGRISAPVMVMNAAGGSNSKDESDNKKEAVSPFVKHVPQFMHRREWFQQTAALATVLTASPVAAAAATSKKVTGPNDGNLPDLPPDAVRSYLQYRIPLQTSADFYLWDLRDMIDDTSDWGDVGQLFRVNNNRGQGQPSRMERDFVNPMRILGLSMPPDIAEEMRLVQQQFETSMARISKATSGIRRDLPVEIDAAAVATAQTGWEEGRVALNQFFSLLNTATGLNEMQAVPTKSNAGQYPRSQRRYLDLAKKTKLCQNRGGPTLSQGWGLLMVSGYLQDSCGIPDLEDYFFQ